MAKPYEPKSKRNSPVGLSPPLSATGGYVSSEHLLTDSAEDGREWTAEELAYLDKIQEQLAGPFRSSSSRYCAAGGTRQTDEWPVRTVSTAP